MSDDDKLARDAEDAAHRAKCAAELGHWRCICAEYAAITALLHPDCPQHGYPLKPKAKP